MRREEKKSITLLQYTMGAVKVSQERFAKKQVPQTSKNTFKVQSEIYCHK
jgi:hypothetical protein